LSAALVILLSIASNTSVVASQPDPEILGIRLGASAANVRELFNKRGISITETGPGEFAAPRPLELLEGVQEVRVHFANDRLIKIVISFQIPPREPTADNLVLLYNKEKDRLKQLFGPPTLDFVDMKAPKPTDRHDWLTRGRAYYRSIWKIQGRMDVSLWLYGEDGGIVLMEMFEKPETR